MKKMKFTLSYVLALALTIGLIPAALAVSLDSFTDISAYMPSKEHMFRYIIEEKGVISGSTSTLLNPTEVLGRGQVLYVLCKVFGIDLSNETVDTPFTDVSPSAYYAKAISWAYNQNPRIVVGTSATLFRPTTAMIRQDFCVLFSRFCANRGITLPNNGSTFVFSDDSSINAYAKDAVYQLNRAGILNGDGKGASLPGKNIPKVALIELLYNYYVPVSEREKNPASAINMTFTEALEMSDSIIIGEYLSSAETDWGAIHCQFKVKKVLRGEVPEETIHMVVYGGTPYATGDDLYVTGGEYILVMNRNDSLFYEYPRYTPIGDIFIPLEDIGKSTMYGKEIREIADKDIAYIEAFINDIAAPSIQEGQRYTSATDYPTIVKETDLILKVTIKNLEIEGVAANSNTYVCSVTQNINEGSFVAIGESQDILITVIKGSVEVGKSYIVMVNRIGESSPIYTQSSLRSIVSLDDEATVAEIYELCNANR
ncbi:MAG: S-layer homology domain-containing protein [Oscillospiraceae bacterium]|nr:S-layer homology domain-containing protein [Oscillospiraceae bacterium]